MDEIEKKPEENVDLTRRSLLSWLGSATVFALTADFLSACADSQPNEPNTNKASDFPFSPSPVEGALYDRWWGNTVDPQNLQQILSSWQLSVRGLVEEPVTLSFYDVVNLTRQNQVTDFHCVEGWSVLDVPWNGLHIDTLINLVRPTSEATHITLRSFRDIYTESIPLAVAREPRTMFAYGIGGSTIPLTHGFPLRLVIPRMYGYKGSKWVREIEFTNTSIDGYWVQRGYPTDAPVHPSRLREGKY
ncbi:MAG: molybdopterin-dependent oxidoreductase [Gammaproteobacteria bacterium]|nr:molybdopterin-dependent oxidoreductase [Gammaproteobacteria bacterium]MDH5803307.1 molybdopterin-dependent oxidoreductase [Gammaproteobacteria bacterium]